MEESFLMGKSGGLRIEGPNTNLLVHPLRIAHPLGGRIVLSLLLNRLSQSFVEEGIKEMSLVS